MKKILGSLFIVGLLAGCDDKTIEYSNDFSAVNFINASPSTPLPQIFIDTLQKTPSAIAYGGSSGYLTATPGNRQIQVRSTTDLKTNFVNLSSETFMTNKASTYIIYDTTSVANPSLKVLRLDDNLTTPDAGFMNFRFLNLAPNSGALDVVFLRTNVTPNDSVVITNQTYIGANPSAAAYSAFNRKAPLGSYTIKLKAAGTQTVLATATPALSVYPALYTFYATGTAAGRALGVGATRQYP